MGEITWTGDLSVGVEALDAQHRGLIALINRLAEPEMTEDGLAEAVQALIRYAARHFTDEETFIIDNAPDLIADHLGQHSRFIETAYAFAQRFHDGEGFALRDEVHDFLCDWLLSHIRVEDRKYAPR